MLSESESIIKKFSISHSINESIEKAFKLWTIPENLAQWFGPKGCNINVAKLEFKVGGLFHYFMIMPDQNKMWGKWVFRELAPPNRVVWINSFSDEKGGLTRHPLNASWPREMLTTVTLAEGGGKTKMTVDWLPINATEGEWKTFDSSRESMKMSWTGTFERLDSYLAQMHS